MLQQEPRATSTTAAAVLMLLVCIPFLINGFDLVQLAQDPSSAAPEVKTGLILVGSSATSNETRTFALFGAVLMLGLCALAIVLSIGVLRRRSGSLQAAAVTFGVLGFMAIAASLTGLNARPPAENAKLGLLVGLVDAAIVVCLLLPSTRHDIDGAEFIRAERKREKLKAKATP